MTVPEGHDRAAKRLLGDVRMIADALRAFVPGSWVSHLDLDTLRPLPAEHVNAELHRRRGDLLWAVDLKGGGGVVIILEAQSTPDPRMPARMMTLTGLVCEDLTAEAMGPDGRMPALLPIVLYTGLRSWTPALDLAERAGPPAELSAHVAGQRYVLLDVRELAKQDLPERNLMSAFVRIEAAASPEALVDALRDTLAWLGDDELGPVFLRWVGEVLMPLRFRDADRGPIDELKESMTMLAERAKQWTEQWFSEGLERGRAQGLEQGRRELVQGRRDMAVRQVRLKFGNAAAERLSPLLDRIADATLLAEVGDWVIQCDDAAELLARTANTARSGSGRTGL
ncbi:MAG: Rpn family recombination-promoting nuclease/putative transposase [Gammaproteobacteria bacterium]|nr:Rpn family recombination-promoting nuclease/putative transposase [Gammaproteobacteria bacterium]